MWTHEITNKSVSDGLLTVTVNFTNGVSDFRRVWSPGTLDQLKRLIQNELNRLAQQEELNKSFENGVLDLTITISPEQQALIDYQQKRQALFQAKQDLELGLIQQADFDVLQTQTLTSKNSIETVSLNLL